MLFRACWPDLCFLQESKIRQFFNERQLSAELFNKIQDSNAAMLSLCFETILYSLVCSWWPAPCRAQSRSALLTLFAQCGCPVPLSCLLQVQCAPVVVAGEAVCVGLLVTIMQHGFLKACNSLADSIWVCYHFLLGGGLPKEAALWDSASGEWGFCRWQGSRSASSLHQLANSKMGEAKALLVAHQRWQMSWHVLTIDDWPLSISLARCVFWQRFRIPSRLVCTRTLPGLPERWFCVACCKRAVVVIVVPCSAPLRSMLSA